MVPIVLAPGLDKWGSLSPAEKRQTSRFLRSLGLSYGEIARLVPISKSTLYGWCRGLELSEESRRGIRERSLVSGSAARGAAGAALRARNERRLDAIRASGSEEVVKFINSPEWISGLVAYWAEGSKHHDMRFSNSDPAMVALFVGWAERFLKVPRSDMTVVVHLHEGDDEQSARAGWARVSGIPKDNFRKTQWKKRGTGHRKRKLVMGIAQVRLPRSGDSLQRVLGWIDGLRNCLGPHPLDSPAGPLAQR